MFFAGNRKADHTIGSPVNEHLDQRFISVWLSPRSYSIETAMIPPFHTMFPICVFGRRCLLVPDWLNKYTDGTHSMHFPLDTFSERTK
jgi:hypothetical protein